MNVRGDKSRVNYLICEVLEDIAIFGEDKICVLFLIDGEIEDYQIATNDPTISFKDETIEVTTLGELLEMLEEEKYIN